MMSHAHTAAAAITALSFLASTTPVIATLRGEEVTLVQQHPDSTVRLAVNLDAVLPTPHGARLSATAGRRTVQSRPSRHLVPGAPVGGVLVGHEMDVWTFDAVAQQLLRVQAASEDFDIHVRLVSPSGNTVATDDDGGAGRDSMLAVLVPVTGQYQIEVTSISREGGRYTVEAESFSAQPIEVNSRIEGSLDGDEIDLRAFEANAGDVVRLAASRATNAYAGFFVRLWSLDGDVMGATERRQTLVTTLRTSGRFLVGVEATYGREPQYELDVRILEANQLAVNERMEGVIEKDATTVWTFDASGGEVIQVLTGSDDLDMRADLLSPDNDELAADDDSGPSFDARLWAIASDTGQHIVVVTATAGSRERGEYYVELRKFASTPLVPNRRADATLGREEVAVWTFDGLADEVVRVDANSEEFDIHVSILAPSGEEVGADDDSGGGWNSQLAAILPTSGGYQIVVSSVGWQRARGQYQIEVRTFRDE